MRYVRHAKQATEVLNRGWGLGSEPCEKVRNQELPTHTMTAGARQPLGTKHGGVTYPGSRGATPS